MQYVWWFVGVCVAVAACERADRTGVKGAKLGTTQQSLRHTSDKLRPGGDTPPNVVEAVGDELEGCGAQPLATAIDDVYGALVSDDAGRRGVAAQIVLTHRSSHARALVQRAIEVVAAEPLCLHLRSLTDTLGDPTLDEATRASAALALGVIARDFPCMFPRGSCPKPHDPLPAWSHSRWRNQGVRR